VVAEEAAPAEETPATEE